MGPRARALGTGPMRDLAPENSARLRPAVTVSPHTLNTVCLCFQQIACLEPVFSSTISSMIITHTTNASGQRRLYIGGKSSLDAWLEPRDDGSWTFHMDEGITAGNPLSGNDKRTWAAHLLLQLARELDVAPADLATVPFEAIAALHSPNPFENRRIPLPKRTPIENSYMATSPTITRPKPDFTREDYRDFRRTR